MSPKLIEASTVDVKVVSNFGDLGELYERFAPSGASEFVSAYKVLLDELAVAMLNTGTLRSVKYAVWGVYQAVATNDGVRYRPSEGIRRLSQIILYSL